MTDMEERKIVSVSRLNEYVKKIFDYNSTLKNFYLKGEISGFKQSGGHYYFSLKDENSQVDCMIFSSYARNLNFRPENGQEVIALCQANFYQKTGRFSLIVKSLEAIGEGFLYAEFERLKRTLAKEGLFDEQIKKPLPKLPNRVAVITSSTGAVIHDIIHVLDKRFPYYNILLFPAIVQGKYSAESIINQLKIAEERSDIDVIVIARGGGSFEDLWSFNDEKLARAIYACHKPVVSAVGHETDFTICDFVSDCRAATPSAAASIIYPDYQTEINNINQRYQRAKQFFLNNILNLRRDFDYISENIKNGLSAKYVATGELLFRYKSTIRANIFNKLSVVNKQVQTYSEILERKMLEFQTQCDKKIDKQMNFITNRFNNLLVNYKHILDNRISNIGRDIKFLLNEKNNLFVSYITCIESYNPELILDKGYAYILSDSGRAMSSVEDLSEGDMLKLCLKDGIVSTRVESIKQNSISNNK